MFHRRFAECSAEYYIREGSLVILTWKLHHLLTIPWYHSILTTCLNTFDIGFDFVLTRDLNTKIYISLVILLLFKYLFYLNTYFIQILILFNYLFYSNTYFIQILILFKYFCYSNTYFYYYLNTYFLCYSNTYFLYYSNTVEIWFFIYFIKKRKDYNISNGHKTPRGYPWCF